MLKCVICGTESAPEYYEIGGKNYCAAHKYLAPKGQSPVQPAVAESKSKQDAGSASGADVAAIPKGIEAAVPIKPKKKGFLGMAKNIFGFDEGKSSLSNRPAPTQPLPPSILHPDEQAHNQGEQMPRGKPAKAEDVNENEEPQVSEETELSPEAPEALEESEVVPKSQPKRGRPQTMAVRKQKVGAEVGTVSQNAEPKMQQAQAQKQTQTFTDEQVKRWNEFYENVLVKLPMIPVGNIVLVPRYRGLPSGFITNETNLLVVYDKLARQQHILQVDTPDLLRLKQALDDAFGAR